MDAPLLHQSHGGGLSWLNLAHIVQKIPLQIWHGLAKTTSDWITLPSYIYIKCLSTLQCSGLKYYSNPGDCPTLVTTLLTEPVTFQPDMFGYNHMNTNHIKSISNTFNMHGLGVIWVSLGWEVPIIKYYSYARWLSHFGHNPTYTTSHIPTCHVWLQPYDH